MQGKIIMGFSGVGKTQLCNEDETIIDLESSLYKYDLEGEEHTIEELKGNRDRKLRGENWLDDYIRDIEYNLNHYNYVLIWISLNTLKILIDKGYEVTIIYPESRELVEKEYLDRYRKRGNSEQFIEDMKIFWDKIMVDVLNYVDEMNTDQIKLIKLKEGEYLKDYI